MIRSLPSGFIVLLAMLIALPLLGGCGQSEPATADGTFRPGELWLDADSSHINAHGGGIYYEDGTYYLITSACTGWTPNEAAYHTTTSIWGPWERHGNPVHGPGADTTFGGQSTFVLPVQGRDDAYIFMSDRNPDDLRNSRYIWLPIDVQGDSLFNPWRHAWDLGVFDETSSS